MTLATTRPGRSGSPAHAFGSAMAGPFVSPWTWSGTRPTGAAACAGWPPRYPLFFDPPNPRVHEMAGCGAYSGDERPIDVAKFKAMAFRINWKLSDDFPYMGMFIPPVKNADERWTRSCDEPRPTGKPDTISCRQMNDYARWMRAHGFHVLNYFNVDGIRQEHARHRSLGRAGQRPGALEGPGRLPQAAPGQRLSQAADRSRATTPGSPTWGIPHTGSSCSTRQDVTSRSCPTPTASASTATTGCASTTPPATTE